MNYFIIKHYYFKLKGCFDIFMKSNDLKLDELIQFSDGWVGLQGRRLLITDTHSLIAFRKDLVEMVGLENTRRIMTRFGYFWGQADAAAMKRIFKWESLTELIKAAPVLHNLQGMGRAMIQKLEIDEQNLRFLMEISWDNSSESESYLWGIGSSEGPICRTMMGHISGYMSYCFGKEVYFIEEKCVAKGDRICFAVGKDIDSWEPEIAKKFKYFKSDDIKANIKKLTDILKTKNKEIQQQRKELNLISPKYKPLIIGIKSKSFGKILDLSNKVAQFDSTVLITGESGVGKEVLAKYIHKLSHRAKGPFLAVNCGALPDTLLESELFGHTEGAFTGAIKERIGLFEQAEGGTIFLDEIGDISPAMQIKLLRVLQEKEIMRLGESKQRKINVRIISATNKNLVEEISKETFREDLFYRLRVIEISIPPLRERRDDILELARFFVEKISKKLNLPNLHLDATCLDFLLAYSWPGNVRELENAIEHAAILCKDDLILPHNFPAAIYNSSFIKIPTSDPLKLTLAQLEKSHIQSVLKLTNNNKTHTAKVLGISQATLWRKIKEYGLAE